MKRGSSLLEVVVYLGCCALITSLAGHVVLNIRKAAQERTQTADAWIALGLAMNRLLSDLKHAPSDPVTWKQREKGKVVFPLQGKDCGWFIDKGRLIRVTGRYAPCTQSWSERATSVVLDSVESLSFRFRHHSPSQLAAVRVMIAVKQGNRIIDLEAFVAFTKETR